MPAGTGRRWVWPATALLLVGIAVAAVVVAVRVSADRARSQAAAERTVADFLRAWSVGDAAAAARDVLPSQAVAAQQLLATVPVQLHATHTVVTRTGVVRASGRAGAGYRVEVLVRGLGTASWTGRVPLVRFGAGWRVAFSPAVVHPALVAGGRFSYVRERAARGRLLTAGGQSLAVDPDLAGNLRGKVGVAPAVGPGPGVATFGSGTATAGNATAGNAGAGTVTTGTAGATGSAAPPAPGDEVGQTGLERALDATLAGQAGGAVRVLDPAGRVAATVLSVRRSAGQDVRTTLDLRTQQAGEAALAAVPQAGSLVAVDTATGHVLALVNHPSAGFGRAVAGKGPPGSTFKIVTSAAALVAGVPPSEQLDCSATATINGRTFKNAENGAAGVIGWQQAFAQSCNTWFVRLQEKVPLAILASTARLFGFATDGDSAAAQAAARGILPIRSFGGSDPAPRDRAQAAGQAIGQDLVLASPLQMAGVAAAVADGTWRRPTVLASPPVPAASPADSHPLPAAVVGPLQTFMAAVVAPGGTAANAGLPAGTHGKTGTAETAASATNPKKTDSWFVGYRGTVAFAVEVDQAGFGADVAAPAAARFLRALS